jgi:hypothetical protein
MFGNSKWLINRMYRSNNVFISGELRNSYSRWYYDPFFGIYNIDTVLNVRATG